MEKLNKVVEVFELNTHDAWMVSKWFAVEKALI